MRRLFNIVMVVVVFSCGRTEAEFDGGLATSNVADASVDAGFEDPHGNGDCAHIVISGLTADRSMIAPGEAVQLSWNGKMARGCELSPKGGSFGGGPIKVTVRPTVTTEYTVGCYGTICWDSPSDWAVGKVTVTVH